MPEKQLVLTILPGDQLRLRELPIEESGILRNDKALESVLLSGRPAVYELGKRITPWVRTRSIVAHFAGDGEGIDFNAGPFDDWRVIPPEIAELDEDTPTQMIKETYKAIATTRYREINRTEGKKALMSVSDVNAQTQGPLSMLVTMTIVAVALVFALILFVTVDNRGGLSEVINFGSPSAILDLAPTPTPTPEPVF
jgi:hypothetical protein